MCRDELCKALGTMLIKQVKQFSSLPHLPVQLLVACGVGLILGLTSLFVSPLGTLGILIAGGVVLVALRRPEIIVLVYLAITSSFTELFWELRFPIGIGTLYLTDLLLIFSFGLIIVRWLVERDFNIIHTPLDWPLLIFLGASLLSTFIAIIGGSLAFLQSLGSVRVVTSYLLFFVATNLVRTKRQIDLLIKGFILLGMAVALVTILQYLLGRLLVFLPGRIETATVEGTVYTGVTRVIPPGQSIILVAFIAVFAALVLKRDRLIDGPKFFQLFLLGLANVVTFFRASWVAAGLIMVIIILLAGRAEGRRLVLRFLVMAAAVAILVLVLMEDPVSGGVTLARTALERVSSLTQPSTYLDPNSSLRWRDFEYGYAIPHILSNPFVGLGLGAMYRPFVHNRDWSGFDGRTFIHNGHIGILMKSGIFGYLGMLGFLLILLIRGLRNWQSISESYMRAIVLAFALSSLLVLIVSNFEPYVLAANWTPVIAVIAGINEVVLCQFSKKQAVE